MTKEQKYDDESQVALGDGWIDDELKRRRKNPKAIYRRHYTDSKCMGLMVWFAKNHRDVSFALRMRVKAPGVAKGERVYDVLGKWSRDPGALNTDRARKVANARRAKYELEGFAETKECPLLDAAIAEYKTVRDKGGNKHTSAKGDVTPASWGEHIERFKVIYADFLKRPVNVLDYDTLLKYRDKYVESRVDDIEDEEKVAAEMKKIHSAFKTVMPMLKLWFRDKHGWIARSERVEFLTPKGYAANTRYILPGEWQAALTGYDALEAECPGAGLLSRFIFASGARPESVLMMQWNNLVTWGKPAHFRDDDGVLQEALIWLPPPETMKGRAKDETAEKPCRLIVAGYALDMLKRLRAIYEANRRENPDSDYRGVFPEKAVALWRDNRSITQREIERLSGTGGGKAKWNRKVLRHSHGVYLEFLGCPNNLRTLSLTHTPSSEGAAAVTDVYSGADPVDEFMQNEELAKLGPWHVKLGALLRDMEEGNTESPVLARIQRAILRGQLANAMCDRYHVDKKFMEVVPVEKKPAKLRLVR